MRSDESCREACEQAAEAEESTLSDVDLAVEVAGSVYGRDEVTRAEAAMYALMSWVHMDDATVASVARALAAWVKAP